MEKVVIRPDTSVGPLRKTSVEGVCKKILTNRENARVILFPGIGRNVEKSTLIVEIARYLAESGNKVLIIDTDMRKDKLTGILNPEKTGQEMIYGLGDYLSGSKSIDNILCMTSESGLFAVFAGKSEEDPIELLSGDQLLELINLGIRYFDYVLIDCSPVDRTRDAEIISTCVDAVIPVVAWGQTEGKAIRKISSVFSKIGVPNLGCILVDMPSGKSLIGRYYRMLLGNK